MPKIKSHRGAAKRFKKTATGKFMRGKAFKRHILTSKPTRRKRQSARHDRDFAGRRQQAAADAAVRLTPTTELRTFEVRNRSTVRHRRRESPMPRVKRGTVRRAKRKKLLKRAKGFYATKSKLYQAAQEAVDKALNYAYSGRRRKKRDFRRLWVVRINAAARQHGLTYGQLISGLKAAGVGLDRKSLADLALDHPAAFEMLAKRAADQNASRPAPKAARA